jgi:dienelactone hydrolase
MTGTLGRAARSSVIFWLLVFTATSLAQDAAIPPPYTEGEFAVVADFMDYDASTPLNSTIVEKTSFDTQTRYKVAFRGSSDEIVPGYLSTPKAGDGPFPCVLLMHGLSGSKGMWWEDGWGHGEVLVQRLITTGYAVFALDAKYHGERSSLDNYAIPWGMFERGEVARLRSVMVESTADYRRGLDWMETREDIDAARIGAIGLSMSGMMLYYLTALDDRVRVAVAGVVPPFIESLAIVPIRVAPYIGETPFALLMGSEDPFYTEELTERVMSVIPSEDKVLKFYDSGHAPPVEYVDDAVEWIHTHLE